MKFSLSNALLALIAFPLVGAILPPDVTMGLLENATEVLYISVLSVEHIHEEAGSCWEALHIDAQVLEVNKSMSGLAAEDMTFFDSKEWNYGDENHTEEIGMEDPTAEIGMMIENITAEMRAGHTALCESGPPPGPSIPPELYPGWCGYVYMNVGEDGHLEMAANGDSFVPAEDLSTCPPVDADAVLDHDQDHEIHDEDHEDEDHEEGEHEEDDHDDHEDHDHDGDGVQDHAAEDHDDEDDHDDHEDNEDHDHDGDGVQDHAAEDHDDEDGDDHDDHDHSGDHAGDSVSCAQPCTTQGSCESGQISVCHGGDENECIAGEEWSSHCADFGDSCGACEALSGAVSSGLFAAAATTMGGFLMAAL